MKLIISGELQCNSKKRALRMVSFVWGSSCFILSQLPSLCRRTWRLWWPRPLHISYNLWVAETKLEMMFPSSLTSLITTFCLPEGHFFFFFFICSEFCHTLKWNSHGFTCVPHPDPPSHLPLHPLPLGLPSAPGPSACLMHPTWAGDLFHHR